MKKMLVVVTLVGLPAGLAIAAASTTTAGRMVIDQQAVDLFHAHVDEQVVGYYDAVCTEIAATQDIAGDFTVTAQDVIGLSPQDAAGMWKKRLTRTADDLEVLARRVGQIDAQAPRAVLRPDGGDEDTDFYGALTPLEAVVAAGKDRIRGVAEDPRWDDSQDHVVGEEMTTKAMRTVGEIPGEVTGTITQVVDHARVFSEATKNAIEQHSSCSSLFAAARVDQDVVLDEVVEAYQKVRVAHQRFGEAMEVVAGLEGLAAEEPRVAQGEIAAVWAQVASVSKDNQVALEQWDNQRVVGSPEWEAVEAVRPFIQDVAQVMVEIARWASQQETATWNAGLSVEGLQTVLDSSLEGLQKQQVSEAKAVTKALTMMPVVNEVTMREIEKTDM
ncbi:hypothetical protein [Corynebacterium mastitidis]|uniref:hypothetical protein n=1 Tax=Corynebacterium mastitidis TaxID=161890 RepID=UPI00254D1A0A|nr:hypothetical protein [Corynebacterium mastitidis]MDK8451457.1 hypothetical protein [Corynebacterium mastitidis]